MNRLELVASLAERDALRYTPAGVPIVTGKLLHASRQMEANVERLVEFEMSALAAGEIAGRFNQIELGETLQFTGFLARRNRNSKSLIFHITNIEHI